MPKVRDVAAVRINLEKATQLTKERRKPRKASYNPPLDHVVVDPRVWNAALRVARYEPKRILVESATSVLVVNQPQTRRRRA